jgi:tetrahydromethanopterin S-methyltransferase subunit G
MKYNRKKLTSKELRIEEINFETTGKNGKKISISLLILLTLSISLIFSVAIYFRLDISGKIAFEYFFTNRPQIEQKADSQKLLK